MTQDRPMNYRRSGVDIEAADRLIESVEPALRRTFQPGWISMPHAFGALFEVPGDYREPVLVSGTDGVGTKLKIAFETDLHSTVGIDLVAMCVNDIIVHGAKPLFFLDYFATGALHGDVAKQVIEGIAAGCEQAGAALIGGETAEMPGMYSAGEYDLAGFAVGVVEKSRIIDGSGIAPGDVIIGAQASGVHSNGFSLIRKVIECCEISLDERIAGATLGETLLTPTRIYVSAARAVIERTDVAAIAHITGGGLPGNVVRVLPDGVKAVIDVQSWQQPEIFRWIAETGGIGARDMLSTFNCGIGMVFIAKPDDADGVSAALAGEQVQSWRIGEIAETGGPGAIELRNI